MTGFMVRVLSVVAAVLVALAVSGATARAQPGDDDDFDDDDGLAEAPAERDLVPAPAPTAAERARRAEQVERAARRVLDDTYQDDRAPRDPAKADPRAKDPRRRRQVERDPPTARTRIRDEEQRQGGGPLGSLASMLMWGVVIAGVILLAVFIARDLFKYADEAGAEPVKGGPAEVAEIRAALDRPLDDADQLAAAGRYAEAIHTLLLRTFQELARTSAVKIAASMTSREILARMPLLGDSRDALADLVMVVELTWFGDDVPGQPEWERCRGQFHRFVAAYQRPGAARAPLPAGSNA